MVRRDQFWVIDRVKDLVDLNFFLGPGTGGGKYGEISLLDLLPDVELPSSITNYNLASCFPKWDSKESLVDIRGRNEAWCFTIANCRWYNSVIDRSKEFWGDLILSPDGFTFSYSGRQDNEDYYIDPPIEYNFLGSIAVPVEYSSKNIEAIFASVYEQIYQMACDNGFESLYYYGFVQGYNWIPYPWESRISRLGFELVKSKQSPYKNRALDLIDRNYTHEGLEYFLNF